MRGTLKLASIAGRIGSLSYLVDLAERDLTELEQMPEVMERISWQVEDMRDTLQLISFNIEELSRVRTIAADVYRVHTSRPE